MNYWISKFVSCIANVEQIPSNIYLFLIDFHRIDALEWAINQHWCVEKRNRKHTHRSPHASTHTQQKPKTTRNFIVHFKMIEAVMVQSKWTTKYGWRQGYRPDEKWWNVNSFISMLFYSHAFDSAFADGQLNLYDANILSTNASFNLFITSSLKRRCFKWFLWWNKMFHIRIEMKSMIVYGMILYTLDDYH